MAAAVRAQQGMPPGMAQPAAPFRARDQQQASPPATTSFSSNASSSTLSSQQTSSSATLPSTVAAQSQQTPPHSLSPSSISPPSPRQQVPTFNKRAPISNVRPAQIRHPKGVGFVPAALRPTERPCPPKNDLRQGSSHAKAHSIAAVRSGPPTPPRSLHSSTDNLPGASDGVTANANAPTASSRKSSSSSHSSSTLMHKLTPIEIPSDVNTFTATGLSSARPSSRGSAFISPTKSFSSASLYNMVASKPPQPTMAHWTPDALVEVCEAPVCPTKFGLINRKHHCRRCGGIFCARHVVRTVPLDSSARMIPTPLSSSYSSDTSAPRHNQVGNTMQTPDESEFGWFKSCDECYEQWVRWVEAIEQARASDGDVSFVDRMQMPGGIGMNVPSLDRKSSTAGSVAGSVPRDWNWSTF